MLKCNIRGVDNGYPLIIESTNLEILPSDYNKDLLIKVLPKVQLLAILSAANNLNIQNRLTSTIDINDKTTIDVILQDEELLRECHHLLFEIHIQDGYLICPQSNRKFPIKDGIPNMLLHEDEV